jgi:hypothetical protein
MSARIGELDPVWTPCGSTRSTDSRVPDKSPFLGATGRDFHNFNVIFRNNPLYSVTAHQIPDIAVRTYPADLAGRVTGTALA